MTRITPIGILFVLLCFVACHTTNLPDDSVGDNDESCDVESQISTARFHDEPAAHALYSQMIEALRNAESLSFVSHYERQITGKAKVRYTYRVWLKKPNYFRIETQSVSGEEGGVMIGDGSDLWIYWPKGRPQWQLVKESEADQKTRFASYMTEPATLSGHTISIWHKMIFLGAEAGFPIIDLSAFHRYLDDTFQAYLDGVKGLGTENIGAEPCDGIKVSFMDHQRSWHLWLSKQDHLPRKLQELIRVDQDVMTYEQWSSVIVNGEMPESLFAWKPPEDWKQWKLPDSEEDLLKPGVKAPCFELTSTDGEQIRLSGYHGRTVWLCFWRVGCQPCREEMPYLQEMYEEYGNKGLVVLGFNVEDNKEIALEYLRKKDITFPNVIDTSEIVKKVCYQDYQNVGGAVPLNYLINGEGRIVDAWFGYSEGDPKARIALEKAGGELSEVLRQEWRATAVQSAEEVTAAAQRLFEAVRSADYARFLNTNDEEDFLKSNYADYTVDHDYPGWVCWVCRKFKDNPITEVHLGEVFAGRGGMPTVHYDLQLQDADVLQGDLSFRWDSQKDRWIGHGGLDWHLQKDH